jgi:hypothetical protein
MQALAHGLQRESWVSTQDSVGVAEVHLFVLQCAVSAATLTPVSMKLHSQTPPPPRAGARSPKQPKNF